MNAQTGAPETREEWDELSRKLRAPFDPREVEFRVQGRASEQTGKAQVVAYIDARVVQDRLDSVVGAGAWAFDWTALVIDQGEVQVAKGTLTIYGVTKSDAGSASNFEQSLGAVSHCFKRAAVHWGIGRYLYNLPLSWVPVERGRISQSTLEDLRSRLPKPGQPAGQDTRQAAAAPGAPAQAAAGTEPRQHTRHGSGSTDAPAPRPAAQPARPSLVGQPASLPVAHVRPDDDPGYRQDATDQQHASLGKLARALGWTLPEDFAGWKFGECRDTIAAMSAAYNAAKKAS